MATQMITPSATTLDEGMIAELRQGMRGALITPDDPDYDEARAVRNGLIDRRPALIAQPTGTADVVACVNFAREHGLLLSVRGGAHNVAGNAVNDGGLVIDLARMRGVFVDPDARTARVQGGATWGDVDHETQLYGLAVPGGVVSTTGIGGLTIHGGYGHLRRTYGLSLDSLLSVEIVTADGQVRTARATENPDLFWAVRRRQQIRRDHQFRVPPSPDRPRRPALRAGLRAGGRSPGHPRLARFRRRGAG